MLLSILSVQQWRRGGTEFSEIKGAGTPFRRVPSYFDPWLFFFHRLLLCLAPYRPRPHKSSVAYITLEPEQLLPTPYRAGGSVLP